MSSRFHNKWHRHNHHTDPIGDPRFPDASHDPIASPESPFRGLFVLSGPLSAQSSSLSSSYAGYFENNNVALILKSAGIALSAVGPVSITGDISAKNIFGNNFYLYNNPTGNVTFGYANSLATKNTVNTDLNTVIGLINTVDADAGLAATSEFNTILGSQNNIYSSYESIAIGNKIILGSLSAANIYRDSLSLGNENEVIGNRSAGIGTYISVSGDDSFVIGTGIDGSKLLTNSQPRTLGIGFSSEKPNILFTSNSLGINVPNNQLPASNLHVVGNAYITGDLTVDGAYTYLDTQVAVSSAMDITNTGTGPALEVRQTGNNIVANFYDDTNSALFIDGRTSAPGYVGINTEAPNHRLTVVGTISATDGLITGATISASSMTIGTASVSLSAVRTFSTPVTATGDFLVLTIDGQPKAIRLWNYL
jgi:hypothetical protein